MITIDLELIWVRSWLEVVDSGGFARAADRVHLSQPRISAHVASLERSLGVTLIERRMRPLTLTEDGRRFLPRARDLIAAVDDVMSDMRSSESYAGRLAIASFASASGVFLPRVILDLRAKNPLVDVRIFDGDVWAVDSMLADHRASVAIRPYRPEPAEESLMNRPLWREPFVVLAPEGHPISRAGVVRLEDLAEYPVITIGDPASDAYIGYEALGAMRAHHVAPPVGIVSHQPTTLAAMVRAGHGLGLVNALVTQIIRLDGLVVKEIAAPYLHRDVGVWWHADRPLSHAASEFVKRAVGAPRPAGMLPVDDSS